MIEEVPDVRNGTDEAARLRQTVDDEHGVIEGRIFVDDDIYKREAEKIFLHTWLFLAHEGQIEKSGDFVTTYMGTDPVIVVRQGDGSIQALLNVCAHRGASVCRVDSGRATTFVCPYHGWTYANSGALRSMPNQSTAYGDRLDKSKWGLTKVARVETYKGLVFGCFDPEAPSLREYLGDMAWYLDCLLDRREGGTEVIGGVHKMRVQGNWKLAAEQFAGDGYHAIMTHGSVPGSWRRPDDDKPAFSYREFFAQPGYQFSSPQGHGVGAFIGAIRKPEKESSASGYSGKAVSRDLELVAAYYDSTRDEAMKRLRLPEGFGPADGSGLVFPNFAILIGVNGSSSIGVFHPKGPGICEYWRWGIVDKAASDEVKDAMVRCLHVWPVGLGDADDAENWSSVQSQLTGAMGRRSKLNYQMGLGQEGPDSVYPGELNPSLMGEYPQRQFYRQWLKLMLSDS